MASESNVLLTIFFFGGHTLSDQYAQLIYFTTCQASSFNRLTVCPLLPCSSSTFLPYSGCMTIVLAYLVHCGARVFNIVQWELEYS